MFDLRFFVIKEISIKSIKDKCYYKYEKIRLDIIVFSKYFKFGCKVLKVCNLIGNAEN